MNEKTKEADFKYQVARYPGGEFVNRCFACGTCTLSCPVSEVEPEYSPRKIIHMILLGLKEEVLSSSLIWYCMTCYRCYVRCPQDVRFPELMRVLRKIAVEEGYTNPGLVEELKDSEKQAQDQRRSLIKNLFPDKREQNG